MEEQPLAEVILSPDAASGACSGLCAGPGPSETKGVKEDGQGPEVSVSLRKWHRKSQTVELIINDTKFTIYRTKMVSPKSKKPLAARRSKKQLWHMQEEGNELQETGGLKIFRRSTLKRTPLARSSKAKSVADEETAVDTLDLSVDNLPPSDAPEACDAAALRLKSILKQLQSGEVAVDVLQRNLQFAVQVLETVYINEDPRRQTEDDDDLSEVQPDAVPPEVREWLASTFTRQLCNQRRKNDEKPRFRTVAHAIRAGIFVERIYRRMSSSSISQFPAPVLAVLKNIDEWSFDVFTLSDTANNQPIRYIGYDLLNRYGIIHKFKIPPAVLETFLGNVEQGYCKYKNPYHNNVHAADVTQTVHYMLCQGIMHWLTDLEIFATLIAAIIHDYEHTGTTNNFHVMSGTDTAMLYNDRAVLENHHVSAAFRLMREDDSNVVNNLSREEYREFRSLVIDMVLATDMSFHFQQIKTMKNLLSITDASIDKSKALSLILHCCDISHPSKDWNLHYRWTDRLIEEFFRQGDKEKELGLPYSPLCDRNNTLVAESQIGFIDFIVEPSMQVCGDAMDKILLAMQNSKSIEESISEETFEGSSQLQPDKTHRPHRAVSSVSSLDSVSSLSAKSSDGSSSSNPSTPRAPISPTRTDIKRPWVACLSENKACWREKAAQDAVDRSAAEEKVEETGGEN